MSEQDRTKQRLEIAHVLFMDIVGYSKLLTDEQSEALQELNQIVRSTEAAREAEAARQLTILPTGDGMALVFTGSVEEPVECALEISHALRAQPSLPVRMGIHSGPVHHVKDANQRENIAGVGINIAQRVMDCGDAGHILVSKRVADDLAQQRSWQPYLHELGDVEVKHGVVVSLVNLYAETIGNPEPPTRIGKVRGKVRAVSQGTRKGLSPVARAIVIIVGLVVALGFVLAIVSLVFAPAIMRNLEQRRSATQSQPSATGSPSLADTIKSAVANQITQELQKDFAGGKKLIPKPPPVISALSPKKSIAVLPFENLSEDKSNAYFTEGIQDEILTRLSKIADLKVISRTSTQHYESAPDNLREIGHQLGVANLLEGSVQKNGDAVRVNVQLIKAADDSHLWADTYDRKLTDIFAVESEIAKTIADTLQAKLNSSAEQVLASRPTDNPEAHELYLKGRYFWNRRTGANLQKAADYFQQAIGKDPAYALAYSGLADCHVLLPAYSELGSNPRDELPKALEAARKAVELDDTLGEAHASLARALASDLQLPAAMSEFKRSIELNPNYATAHQWFGECLQSQGHLEEALVELKRAQELDPLSLIINSVLGFALDTVGKSDEAIAQLRKTIEIDPNFLNAHGQLGNVLEHRGRLKEAIVEYERCSGSLDPIDLAQLTAAYFLAGRKAEAQQDWDKLKSLSERQYVPAYSMAIVQVAFGDKDEAIRLLEKSYEDRAPFDSADLGWILVDHRLDPLRNDPRFKKLITRIFSGEPR
jgi:TolB-like protein/Tfp pilus assembly protein PilF/class 3 adenylate cyclase